MTLAIRTLPHPDSPLRSLDARWRLAALVLAAGLAAVLRSPPAAVLALGIGLGVAALGRLPVRWASRQLLPVLAVLGLFAVTLPFLTPDPNPLWTVGVVSVSGHGIAAGLVLLCKGLTILLLALVLLTSAPLETTLKAAHSLRVPGVLVHLTLLSYRYLFILASELDRLRVALRVRGYRNRMSGHSYHTVGRVCGTLLVRGHDRAERVSQAMRCRGFDGRLRTLTDFRTRPTDVLFALVLVGAFCGLALWDRGWL